MLLKDPYTMDGKEAMDIIWTEGCIDLDGPTSESGSVAPRRTSYF